MNTQTTEIRVRKNFLGTQPGSSREKCMSLFHYRTYEKYILNPPYQRDITWCCKRMNDLIGTVMNNGYIPEILTYKYQEGEEVYRYEGEKKIKCKYEVIDGQHRLFTLKAFFDSTFRELPNISKKFIVYWNYENKCIFYNETDDVKEWCHDQKITPYYLTDEEKSYFDDFYINVKEISNKLTLYERRKIFITLQQGVQVKNSDLYKNYDNKIFELFRNNDYEKIMKNIFLKHCYRKATKYWVHWVVRCYTLFCFSKNYFSDTYYFRNTTSQPSLIFVKRDTDIKNAINKNSTFLNSTPEIMDEFHSVFTSFIDFLKKCGDIKFNPTQIFALFYSFCQEWFDSDIILTHMTNFSKDCSKEEKKMWEPTDTEIRRSYFNTCLEKIEINNMNAYEKDTKQITKALKKDVWKKCLENRCYICEEQNITEDNFEAGHIIAKSIGGPTVLDNLLPMCFDCNRNMGKRNAIEYKKDIHPHKKIYDSYNKNNSKVENCGFINSDGSPGIEEKL